MLCHIQRGLGLHALDASQYVRANGLPWPGGSLSLLNGASPAAAKEDTQACARVTTPDGFAISLSNAGVPTIFANGDLSGQHFLFDCYDWSLRKWMGSVVEYMNNHTPIMLDTQPHTIPLVRDIDMSPLDISTFCVDQDGDDLVITSPDNTPPGTTFVANVLSGIPDTPGSYPMHFTATDPAGGALTFPLFTFVVGVDIVAVVDQTVTVFKSKAGIPGPSGGGTDGLTVNMTQDSYLIFCYAEGTPIDPTLGGANGNLTVFKGSSDDTAASTLSATGVGCTGTINTANDVPVVGQLKGYYRVTGITVDNAQLKITIVNGGATLLRSFNVSKIRAGYEIVGVLPTTNLFDGRMVYLTTDGKLYRYKAGTGWTAAVAATDMTGQLTDAQIAAIAAAKLTGQITSTQITDGSISTPKLAAGSVTSANIAAGTIVAADIAAGSITAVEIAAGAITASEIGANAVTANAILAGSIIAAKLAASNVVTATAQIGDLIVSTIKIQGDAVTDAAQVYVSGSGGGALINVDALSSPIATPTWFNLASTGITYTSAGGRLMVNAFVACPPGPSGASNDYLAFRIVRDSTIQVGTITFFTCVLPGAWSGIMGYWAGFFYDQPSAGSHTYQMQYTCHSTHVLPTQALVNDRGIQIMEAKR